MDDDLEIPFIFVPHGAPEPTEWMALHPGWVKFPATFVPHGAAREPVPVDPPSAEPAVAHRPAIEAEALSPRWRDPQKSFAPVPRQSPLTGWPGAAPPPLWPIRTGQIPLIHRNRQRIV